MTKINVGLEYLHHDLYGVAMEVVKKFVSKSDTRPILTNAYHTADGDVFATDSHRVIHLRGIHGFKEDYLVNPKTFMFAKGNYPNVPKSIEQSEQYVGTIELNKTQIKLWLQIFKSINNTLKVMKTYNKTVKFSFAESVSVKATIDSETTFKTVLPKNFYINPGMDEIAFSAEFMRDALEAHFKLNSEKLVLYFYGQFRPMILDDGETVKTVILPVRTC